MSQNHGDRDSGLSATEAVDELGESVDGRTKMAEG